MPRVHLHKEVGCNPQDVWNFNNFKTWTRLNVKFTLRNKGPRGRQDTLKFLSLPPCLQKAPLALEEGPWGLTESRQVSAKTKQKRYALVKLRWELAKA